MVYEYLKVDFRMQRQIIAFYHFKFRVNFHSNDAHYQTFWMVPAGYTNGYIYDILFSTSTNVPTAQNNS